MRNSYVLNFRLLEQMLFSLDYLLQEVLVQDIVIREVKLETAKGSDIY